MSLRTLSPLDGRYGDRLKNLSSYFSEWALIKYRIHVEIEWLITMAERPEIEHVRTFTKEETDFLRSLVIEFDDAQAQRVKEIEAETRHDVKAVEYYVREALAGTSLQDVTESVHFCCTSEDINNLAYALMLKDGIQEEWLPNGQELISAAAALAAETADVPMLSRTHGQSATPTTVGKELAVFVSPLAAPDRPGRRQRIPRQVQRGGGELQRAPRRLSRRAVGSRRPPFRRRPARTYLQPAHHTDRASRLHGRTLPPDDALQRGAARFRPGHVVLYLPRPFPPEGGRHRNGVVRHAPQGEPHRLRELRGQRGPQQRAAGPPGRETAGFAAATGPERLLRPPERRRGHRPFAAGDPLGHPGPGARGGGPRRGARRPRGGLGGAGGSGADGHAQGRRREPLRAGQGADPGAGPSPRRSWKT